MTNECIPEKGYIVWVDFDPSVGLEIQKRHPAFVISKREFNLATKSAVVCPISSTKKDIPTRHTLSSDYQIQGQVLIHQLRSIDFNIRKIDFIERIKSVDMGLINQLIDYII